MLLSLIVSLLSVITNLGLTKLQILKISFSGESCLQGMIFKPLQEAEKKIILIEKKAPTQEILNILKEITSKKEKPFFDDKTQLDLNCLWISSLVAANEILPEMK